METVFLACFAFGALFTLASVLLGAASGGHGGADLPHTPHGVHLPHAGHDLALPHAAPAGGTVAGGDAAAHPAAHSAAHVTAALPIFNFSSALAFLTWFGGAGYVLLTVAAWPLWGATAAAVAVGAVGAWLVALFLAKVLAGERVLRPGDYRLEGTLARVTVTLPEGGAGEIVFPMAGARRSEAARSLSGRAVARGTEVVILAYERGVATVQPWEEFTARNRPEGPQRDASSADARG